MGLEADSPDESRIRLGLLLAEPKSRPDLLRLVHLISERFDTTAFVASDDDVDVIANSCPGIPVVALDTVPAGRRAALADSLFDHFRASPRPRRHQRGYQLRRLDKLEGSAPRQAFRRARIEFISRLPCVLDYGWLLERQATSTELDSMVRQLDVLIVVSDVSHDGLLAAAIAASVPTALYVYSWDHPPKFARFPRGACSVGVWSEAIGSDVAELHGVPHSNLLQLPPTQYAAIMDRLDEHQTKVAVDADPYVYFPASFGYPTLAEAEVQLVTQVADLLQQEFSDLRLRFRGYPHLQHHAVYEPLGRHPKIDIDSDVAGHGTGLDQNSVQGKTDALRRAVAVLHAGTTVGIEAALCGTPVIYLTCVPEKTADRAASLLESAWDQHHLQRFFAAPELLNHASNMDQLRAALTTALEKPDELCVGYGDGLRELAGAMKTEDLLDSWTEAVSRLANGENHPPILAPAFIPEDSSGESIDSRAWKWLIRDLYNVAIAGVPSRRVRRFWLNRLLGQLDPSTVVCLRVRLLGPRGVRVGKRTVVGTDSLLDGRGGLTIGDDVDIAPRVNIWTLDHDPSSPTHETRAGAVNIEHHAWIAAGATILPGVRVAAGAIVGAGAVVARDVEELEIVGGAPAAHLGWRKNDLTYQLDFGSRFR